LPGDSNLACPPPMAKYSRQSAYDPIAAEPQVRFEELLKVPSAAIDEILTDLGKELADLRDKEMIKQVKELGYWARRKQARRAPERDAAARDMIDKLCGPEGLQEIKEEFKKSRK
jgi:hypothetical protein